MQRKWMQADTISSARSNNLEIFPKTNKIPA